MSGDFQSFVSSILDAKLVKSRHAESFIWWAEHRDRKPSISMDEICTYFEKARLPQPNRTRLEQHFRGARYVLCKLGRYQLSQEGMRRGNDLFAKFLPAADAEEIILEINPKHCPYINENDLMDARKMADTYVSLFCLENSIRRHVAKILADHLGRDWWDLAASSSMKKKEQDRRRNEEENKWIPSRSSAGPLYSLDWPDLVTLMRKYEELFRQSVTDINFLHRFVDLGNLRNVVAHHGVIDDPMQFRRVELAIHDWSKQIGRSNEA